MSSSGRQKRPLENKCISPLQLGTVSSGHPRTKRPRASATSEHLPTGAHCLVTWSSSTDKGAVAYDMCTDSPTGAGIAPGDPKHDNRADSQVGANPPEDAAKENILVASAAQLGPVSSKHDENTVATLSTAAGSTAVQTPGSVTAPKGPKGQKNRKAQAKRAGSSKPGAKGKLDSSSSGSQQAPSFTPEEIQQVSGSVLNPTHCSLPRRHTVRSAT